jgi:homoaconitate hydratase
LAKRRGSPHPRHSLEALDRLEKDPANKADSGARFAANLTLDLSSVEPHIAGPNTVKKATPLSKLASKGIPIQKAYLVSCVNSRVSDLRAAAEVIKGQKVAPGVEFYVAAASSEVEAESKLTGDWAALMAAGAKPLPAGCGPCIGTGRCNFNVPTKC